ncbi:MAG: hypothetical protein NVS9B10_09320 [Nevskia sp.]
MSAGWHFRPPLWAVCGVIAGCALTCWLGVWQLHRGHAREALDAQYRQATQVAAIRLNARTAALPDAQAVAAEAEGVYVDQQLLLDNQVRERIPGYQVLTPLRLADGGLVLVNRGWLPQNPDRRVLPALPLPSGALRASGLWRALPQPALRLQTQNCAAAATATWPRIVEYPTPDDLACLYPGRVVAPGMLLLAPEAGAGFVREWTQADVRFPPSRHYAYAAQWFAFAATLLVIFFKLNLRRRLP